jgi:hypothetical protein
MEKIEVTFNHVIKIWWSYIWRCALFSGLLGFIGGLVVGLMVKAELAPMVGAVLGYIGSIPVSIYVLYKILNKKFSNFSIVLINEPST